jgi:spore germination cell wall hydrolase CwlJ-like protein
VIDVAPQPHHGGGALAAAALAMVTACAAPRLAPAPALAPEARDFSAASQGRLEASMDPSMLVLAHRFDGGRRADLGGRPVGWAVLDISTPPTLGLGALSFEEAERLNAFLPASGEPPAPAAPFVLKASAPERERALLCMTQAIYYEAALEPTPGQEAVAQTVLNRVRHPAFPKSICGVIYQGAQLATGCQFSFTCDGSRDRPPVAQFWQRAQSVAERALAGYVMKDVGDATAYHADYVFPRWGPTLTKIRQFGAQIFYRFPGPAGQPGSFRGHYGGGELAVSMAGPSPAAILAARAAAGPGQSAPETYSFADPTAPGGVRTRVAGQIVFGRRVPTREEIARINAALAAMPQAAPAAPPEPPSLGGDAPAAAPKGPRPQP